jgi:hypothetical protein
MSNSNENQPTGALNRLNGRVPYATIKGNVGPYVKSRVWANRVKTAGNIAARAAVAAAARGNNEPMAAVNLGNKRPTLKMVKLALAQALGVRYTTTGRGGGLEDAPFIPGVSALPTIQRAIWSTEKSHMPVDDIRRIMDGHWGITGISNNIAKMPANTSNNRGRVEPLINGAISSFYHPAFTQVCRGNGEWLINGFKVQKTAAVQTAAALLGRNAGNIEYTAPNREFLVGSGTKGTIAAEADIAKIAIINWPRSNSNNYSRTRIIFTIGEDKVGPGESAQAHGKEVAQLRFIMFAIYYMWLALHQPGADPHPWSKIPVQNITLEAVFLAAGAGTVQNTKISNQASGEKTGILFPGANFSQKKVINIVPVNLDKFCAIFRIDAYRFAEAMTAVDKKFRDKMIEYFQSIANLERDPRGNMKVNNTTMINVSAGLATTKLSNATLRGAFRPVVLRAPRTNWANNQNRKNWELMWLQKYNSAGGPYRKSINNAMAAFGQARGSVMNRNNVASYYSGESNVNALTRAVPRPAGGMSANNREALKAQREAEEAAADAARVEAAKAARKAAIEAGAPDSVRRAIANLTRSEGFISAIKPQYKQPGKESAEYKKQLAARKAAQNVLNIYTNLSNNTKRMSNITNRIIGGNFEQDYATFLRDHSLYAPFIKNAFNKALQYKIQNEPNQANIWQSMLNSKPGINTPAAGSKKRKINTSVKGK